MQLAPAPLTSEAFAQFGDVIQTEGAQHFEMNGGKLERYYDRSITHQFHDPALVLRNNRVNHRFSQFFQCMQCSSFIFVHEPAVADYVCSHNSCKASLDAFFDHARLLSLKDAAEHAA